MDDQLEEDVGVFCKNITESGQTITLVVAPTDDKNSEWMLTILGKSGQLTSWTEFFDTPEDAINEGMAAVLNEGVATFYSDPEFDAYL